MMEININIVETESISLDQFVELIRADEKLRNIKKILERCDYPTDEVKAILDIGKQKEDATVDKREPCDE